MFSFRRALVHGGLFFATVLTTAWVGSMMTIPKEGDAPTTILEILWQGLPFSLSLLSILLTHEMGHYVFARLHRVEVSLPYFIPFPFGPFGTLGAVIRMRGKIESRDALVDIGASGPIAGLIVAIPVLAYGISQSEIIELQSGGYLEGNSMLYLAIKWMVTGRILPSDGVDVNLHPIAWAGWGGLLVTMINLLPIGQLDGGHIAFAFFGQVYERASLWVHRGLLALALGVSSYVVWDLARVKSLSLAFAEGASAGMPWLVFAGLLLLMKRMSGGNYHPPVGDRPLSPRRRILCYAMLIVFAMIFTPIPLRPT